MIAVVSATEPKPWAGCPPNIYTVDTLCGSLGSKSSCSNSECCRWLGATTTLNAICQFDCTRYKNHPAMCDKEVSCHWNAAKSVCTVSSAWKKMNDWAERRYK